MKTTRLIFSLASALLISSLVASVGWTKVTYDSEALRMKNAEQLNALVLKKIKRAEEIQKKQDINDDAGIVAEPDAINELREAMMIVLARPDLDGTRANTFARIRRELTDLSSYEHVLKEINSEAITSLKDKSTAVKDQASYIIMLENMMSEIKPDISTNAELKKIVEDIRDADIKISDKVRSQQLLRSMTRPVSPSTTAISIIGKKK